MEEVAAGLRRWTTSHEEWGEDVGALAVDTSDGLVLIDPIDVPAELDRPAHVLYTVFWHARRADIADARVWAAARGVRRLANRGVEITDPVDGEAQLPGGIRALPTARDAEGVYWLPQHGAVAVGDVLLGAGAKPRATADPLRLCPERWLRPRTLDDLRDSLRLLLDLSVERVLVSHGAPVLERGGDALAAVLG